MFHVAFQTDSGGKHVCNVSDSFASSALYVWQEWASVPVGSGKLAGASLGAWMAGGAAGVQTMVAFPSISRPIPITTCIAAATVAVMVMKSNARALMGTKSVHRQRIW